MTKDLDVAEASNLPEPLPRVSSDKKHHRSKTEGCHADRFARKKETGGNYYPTADSRLEGEGRWAVYRKSDFKHVREWEQYDSMVWEDRKEKGKRGFHKLSQKDSHK